MTGVQTCALPISLNCGPGSGDDREHVIENRRRALSALDTGCATLLTLYQIHSRKAVSVSEPWDIGTGPQADAMATTIPGLALGILTADCAPVDVITGPGNVYVAAAKRVLAGRVAVDAEAGPTEIAIIADDTADPEFVAADLIARATSRTARV